MKYGFLTAFAEAALLGLCIILVGTCALLYRTVLYERNRGDKHFSNYSECVAQQSWWKGRFYQLNFDTLDGVDGIETPKFDCGPNQICTSGDSK